MREQTGRDRRDAGHGDGELVDELAGVRVGDERRLPRDKHLHLRIARTLRAVPKDGGVVEKLDRAPRKLDRRSRSRGCLTLDEVTEDR